MRNGGDKSKLWRVSNTKPSRSWFMPPNSAWASVEDSKQPGERGQETDSPRRQVSSLGPGLDGVATEHKSAAPLVDTQPSCALREYIVPLERISETQLVLCHPERELLPLVLSHCHYTLKKGGETDSSYDLPAIQMQLVRRYLAGKPLIKEVKTNRN